MSGMYAKDTSVSVERSRAEIETILGRYGASAFAYATEANRAMVGFRITDTTGTNLAIRMTLPLPARDDEAFTRRKSYGNRIVGNDPMRANKLWEQACRSSWRALCLVIKAKLEACAVGISTVEREFMADVVTPDGRTIGQILSPQLKAISDGGTVPRLLPAA